MARTTAGSWIDVALLTCVVTFAGAWPVVAQQTAPPAFVDERRLPPTDTEIKAKAEADRLKAAAQEAKDKAEAQKRDAAESEAKQKAEEQRRQAAESEAKQKAEEQRRQSAEAEAKQKAEEQRRQSAEAEAKQKAEEQRRQSAEAEAKQKAEEQRRQSAEAEAKQKAEEQRRQSAEAEAKQKAEEQRRQAADAAKQKAARPLAPPAPTPAVRTGATECGPDRISARAINGGRVEINVDTPCRPGQSVVVRYGVFELKRQLDGAGRGIVILDLFQGKSPAVSLQIGTSPAQPVSLDAVDLSGISKAAVVWQAPVNLDLHIYEYAARHGDAGHIWPGAPSTAEAAETEARASQRGRGFLSTSDDGRADGDKVEVYTLWHHAEQRSGLVATALDFETRGAAPSADTCGDGAHASVVYETFLLNARGELSRERGVIAPATCGSQLAGAGRYMEDAVPDLSAAP